MHIKFGNTETIMKHSVLAAIFATTIFSTAAADCPSPLSCQEQVAAALSPLLNPTASAEAVRRAKEKARALRESGCEEHEREPLVT